MQFLSMPVYNCFFWMSNFDSNSNSNSIDQEPGG